MFSVVFLLIWVWPLESLNPETAKTARLEAQAAVTQSTNDLKAAAASPQLAMPQGPTRPSSSGPAKESKGGPAPSTSPAGPSSRPDALAALVQHLEAAADGSLSDLAQKKAAEDKSNSSTVLTRIAPSINRELDMLLLVLLAGMLGAFLHLAQSYAAFAGNRTLKSSWIWWYLLRPFIGGGLALVFYAAVRGGLVSIVPSSHTSTADLNTPGLWKPKPLPKAKSELRLVWPMGLDKVPAKLL